MSDFYQHHAFFCTHTRDDGTAFCEEHGANELRDYAKTRVKELKLKRVRINNSGCLNRCKLGPVMVIYPEGIWYQYHSKEDIDEIIESHIKNGIIVERLKQ
jgi:(2Fe-2S) ferredoxin